MKRDFRLYIILLFLSKHIYISIKVLHVIHIHLVFSSDGHFKNSFP